MKQHITKEHICQKYKEKYGGEGNKQYIYDDDNRKLVEGEEIICPYCFKEYNIIFEDKLI